MTIQINFKICDNAKECPAMASCPKKAIYWNRSKRSLDIDSTKCINCGICAKTCTVKAIRLSRTEEEYKRIKKEIENDPRKVSDLFVDRYGAVPIHEAFMTTQDKFDIQVLQSVKLCAVEFYNEDSIECLRRSIPIKTLFKDIDVKYRKIKVVDDSLIEKYSIKKLPSLVFFKDGKMIKKIEGYKDKNHQEEMVEKVRKIVN